MNIKLDPKSGLYWNERGELSIRWPSTDLSAEMQKDTFSGGEEARILLRNVRRGWKYQAKFYSPTAAHTHTTFVAQQDGDCSLFLPIPQVDTPTRGNIIIDNIKRLFPITVLPVQKVVVPARVTTNYSVSRDRVLDGEDVNLRVTIHNSTTTPYQPPQSIALPECLLGAVTFPQTPDYTVLPGDKVSHNFRLTAVNKSSKTITATILGGAIKLEIAPAVQAASFTVLEMLHKKDEIGHFLQFQISNSGQVRLTAVQFNFEFIDCPSTIEFTDNNLPGVLDPRETVICRTTLELQPLSSAQAEPERILFRPGAIEAYANGVLVSNGTPVMAVIRRV